MKNLAIILFSILLCVNVVADDKTTKASKSLAMEYLKVIKMEEMNDAVISQYESQMFSKATPEERAKFHELMIGSMGWDATKDQLVDLIIAVYTKEELEATIAFMKTPVGASATAKSTEFSRQYANLIAANMKKVIANNPPAKKVEQ